MNKERIQPFREAVCFKGMTARPKIPLLKQKNHTEFRKLVIVHKFISNISNEEKICVKRNECMSLCASPYDIL